MDIKNVGSNMTQVGFNGNQILYSYSTPVAAWDNERGEYVRTDKFWSQTTSRHINKWIGKVYSNVHHVSQSGIDNLADFHQSHLEPKHDN